jgi:hypothetical protein
LGKQPVDSVGTLVVQLLDSNSKPISRPATINTYQDCQKNLVLVNFVEIPDPHQYVLPVIMNASGVGSN